MRFRLLHELAAKPRQHLVLLSATPHSGKDETFRNLLGLLVLRRFQEAGHRPIALAGGATGMVGDPSGRSEERNLLDEATLAANVAAIKAQLAARTAARQPGPSEQAA